MHFILFQSFGDWRGYVKKKAADRHKLRRETGRGVTSEDPGPLSELEEKLLFMIGKVAAEGSKIVNESAVIVDIENVSINIIL